MKNKYAAAFYKYVDECRPEYECLGEYVKTDTKLLMRHLPCGTEWLVRPHDFKDKHSGCPTCALIKDNSKYADSFYKFVKEKRPTYECLSTYVNNSTKVLMRHKSCGYEWLVRPNYFKDHLGSCPKCSGRLKGTTEDLVKWIANNRSEYMLLGPYTGTDKKVSMQHLKCGTKFNVTPHDFKSSLSSCPKCSKASQYSQAAIAWLNTLSSKHNINIQHAENGGEYRLPKLNYKVDGFCHENNTVFEFHGSAYHGGYDSRRGTLISAIPNKYPEDLFEHTCKRMHTIASAGYSVFYVFDSDLTSEYLGDYY